MHRDFFLIHYQVDWMPNLVIIHEVCSCAQMFLYVVDFCKKIETKCSRTSSGSCSLYLQVFPEHMLCKGLWPLSEIQKSIKYGSLFGEEGQKQINYRQG